MSISYLSTSLPASESQNIQVNNLLVNGNTTVLGSLTASTTIHTNLEVTNSISLTSPFTASVFYFYNGEWQVHHLLLLTFFSYHLNICLKFYLHLKKSSVY